MAIFRLEAKIIGREKRGHSAVAAAAYRAGRKLHDERNHKTHDYSRRQRGILQSAILAPDDAPPWVHDPAALWNAVERSERRVDAQLAREFILAVPKELSPEAQFQTARDWASRELVGSGMVVELYLHHSRNGKNPHVHILCTMRRLDGDAFSKKKSTEWNDVALLVHQRESWASAVNAALAQAGSGERVDHRSLKEQGIDREPEPKIGPVATGLKKRGVVDDSKAFQRVREVRLLNELRPMLNAITKNGEVEQQGMGASWWERSVCFLSRVRERAVEKVKNTWQKFLDSERGKERRDEPDFTR